jgi:tetratricopeptide (TPR) repeat protein
MTDTTIDIDAWRRNIRQDVQINYHASMGWALLAEGSNDAAADHFRRVLAVDATVAEARWGLAHSLGQPGGDGPPDVAARALTQLAKALLLRSRRADAVPILQEALRRDGDCADALIVSARLQAEDKHWALVLEQAVRAGTLAPDHAAEAGLILHHAAGQCLGIPDYPLAEQLAAASCRMRPDSALFRELWGSILVGQARYAEAAAAYDGIDPAALSPVGRFGLAACCLLLGQFQRGLQAMEGVLEAKHDPVMGTIVLSALQLAVGNSTEALARVTDTLARHPDHLLLTMQKAFLLGECGEPGQALRLADGLVAPDPLTGAYIQFRRAGILLRANRLGEAEEAARSAVATAPDRPSNHRQLARVLAARGLPDQAAAVEAQAAGLVEPFNPVRWLPPA